MPRLAPALCGLLLAATHATADVTPRQVWDDWVASLDRGEAEVTTDSLQEETGRLSARGVAITNGTAEEGRYEVRVEEVTLLGNDDGSIGVAVSSQYPVVLTDTDEEGTLRETRLSVEHPGLEMTVSDEAGGRAHDFEAPELRVTIEEVQEGGEPLDVAGSMVLTEVEGRYDAGEASFGQSTLTASQLQASFGGTDPEGEGRFALTLAMEGLESENMLELMAMDTGAMVRAMPRGSSRVALIDTSASSFTFDTESEGETVRLVGTAGPGRAEMTLSPDGVSYASEGEDATLTFSGDTIPLPQIAIEIARATTEFAMPVLAAEEPQPYAVAVSMTDVVLDEGLWNMFDPAGILPRDPGAITLNVTGDMIVEDDIGAPGVGDEMTGDVRTVEINTLRLELAKTEVLASGVLEMAETGGGQRPVGEIDIVLSGANRLLERLVQAGVLPQEQSMGMMMMLGMFTTPGASADELTSAIRFTEDGRVFVNDQQVR